MNHNTCPIPNVGVSPEETLWRAVLRQQWIDAFQDEVSYTKRHDYHAAHSYLSKTSANRRLVCDLADIDDGWLQRKYDERLSLHNRVVVLKSKKTKMKKE